jgi:hypothetical protein
MVISLFTSSLIIVVLIVSFLTFKENFGLWTGVITITTLLLNILAKLGSR